MAQGLQEHQERVHDGNTATQLGDLYPEDCLKWREPPLKPPTFPLWSRHRQEVWLLVHGIEDLTPLGWEYPGPRGTVALPAAALVDTLAETAPPGAEQGAASGAVLGERLHAARSPPCESVPSCPWRGSVLPPPGMAP